MAAGQQRRSVLWGTTMLFTMWAGTLHTPKNNVRMVLERRQMTMQIHNCRWTKTNTHTHTHLGKLWDPLDLCCSKSFNTSKEATQTKLKLIWPHSITDTNTQKHTCIHMHPAETCEYFKYRIWKQGKEELRRMLKKTEEWIFHLDSVTSDLLCFNVSLCCAQASVSAHSVCLK